jgi:hypothetical protein
LFQFPKISCVASFFPTKPAKVLWPSRELNATSKRAPGRPPTGGRSICRGPAYRANLRP